MAAPTRDNADLIRELYAALGRSDGDAMAKLYAPSAQFEDPVFGKLDGREAGEMWRMLTSRSKDLEVELEEAEADGERGHARWVARYTFTQTGRHVVNVVRAEFRFSDGLIADHKDSFSRWMWSRQALGPMGALFGWGPPLSWMLHRQARESLEKFMSQ
jgi:ketosteroid isomerase-like protein